MYPKTGQFLWFMVWQLTSKRCWGQYAASGEGGKCHVNLEVNLLSILLVFDSIHIGFKTSPVFACATYLS